MASATPSSSSSQVRVGVRIRPLASKEISQGGQGCLNVVAPSIGIGQRQFTYDTVFDTHISQQDLYDNIATPLLTSFTAGYNATIMAYGQTGSGKTFTMGSEAHTEPETASHAGLIPRFVADFFTSLIAKKEASDSGKNSKQILIEYSLTASFLEVYGEDIHDLLDPDRKSLPLRENSDGEVVMAGLTNRSISNAMEALQVLHEGTMNRTTAATLMNLTSSRSHAVFTIYLTQIIREDEVDVKTVSKFTFVDLAGSERMKKTGAEGERAREGIKINEGLLALGNVINALADEERLSQEKRIHVPYRQSKLTRLLQDALGGNSQTLFLACVSPSDTNASETLSTLHYANRARNIRNAPTKNVDATAAELQRLKTLTHILQCELVNEKFIDSRDDISIGNTNEDLLHRDDVKEYLQMLINKASDGNQQGSFSFPTIQAAAVPHTPSLGINAMPSAGTPFRPLTTSTMTHPRYEPTPMKKEDMERFGDTFLVDVDPDQDIAILDKLIELQRHDQDFDNQQKQDEEKLDEVEKQIEKEEKLLLQLKENLKVYHNMKEKYEALMAEVQQLESEKDALADQLDRAVADPTTGSSVAIKKKLEKVEQGLARAKREAQKHREMYRKVEQEAKRCRILERKVSDLKVDRVALLKKQKETEARYREANELKTKQLLALKRKNRAEGQKVSNLENELRTQKMGLQKRKLYIDKLTTKLKQTENHFEKFRAMRQRDHKRRVSSIGVGRRSSIAARWSMEPQSQELNTFASIDDTITSLKTFVEKLVAEQVVEESTRIKYEEKVTVYNDVMQNLIQEVKALSDLEEESKRDSFEASDESQSTLAEHRQAVADMEFKIEVLSAELDLLRRGLPGEQKSRIQQEEQVRGKIGEMTAPVLRTSLLEAYSAYADSEMKRKRSEAEAQRKDSSLKSMENELESYKDKTHALTKELQERRILVDGDEDVTDMLNNLRQENVAMTAELASLKKALAEKDEVIAKAMQDKNDANKAADEAREQYAIFKATYEQHNLTDSCQAMTAELQSTWGRLGVESSVRAESMKLIESSVAASCQSQLEEARKLEHDTSKKISALQQNLDSMLGGLGKSHEEGSITNANDKLLSQHAKLKDIHDKIKPEFEAALERQRELTKETHTVSMSINLANDDLPMLLKQLVRASQKNEHRVKAHGRRKRASMMKDISGLMNALSSTLVAPTSSSSGLHQISEEDSDDNDNENGSRTQDDIHTAHDSETADAVETVVAVEPGCLSNDFLDKCEEEIVALRVKKSQLLVKAREILQTGSAIVRDMHMSSDELKAVMDSNTRSAAQGGNQDRNRFNPAWWNPAMANSIIDFLNTSHSASMDTSEKNLRHLEHIADILGQVAKQRRLLTNALRNVVEESQQALLSVVESEDGVQQAYSAFHEALERLPPLSRDFVDACTSELEALRSGADTMAQSEVEALTVVWEAMDASFTDRQQFWHDVDTLMGKNDFGNQELFSKMDAASASMPYSEDWVVATRSQVQQGYSDLKKKLFKLNAIHGEVEKLRLRQDSKSQILSLDGEVRMLDMQLREFEENKCHKDRLMSKKSSNGKSLLKEERFRRHMKGKFTSKLDQLAELLKTWQTNQGNEFDTALLSQDVKQLLKNPDGMQSAVRQRTKLMPLRTVQSSSTPGRKRQLESHAAVSTPTRSSSTTTANDKKYKSGLTPPKKKYAATSTKHKHLDRAIPKIPLADRMVSEPSNNKTASNTSNKRNAKGVLKSKGISMKATAEKAGKHKVRRQNEKSPRKNMSAVNKDKMTDASLPVSKLPISPRMKASKEQRKRGNSSALLPFGRVLDEASSPYGKENKDNNY